MAAVVEDNKKSVLVKEGKPPICLSAPVSVFSDGPYTPTPTTVNKPWFGNSPPKSLYIVSPKEKGTYNVIAFFPGTSLTNTTYSGLFNHLASHGYIIVAPQLYDLLPPKGNLEVEYAAQVLNWLPTATTVLESKLPDRVELNLDSVALMGHSRGGLVAFALALGYATTPSLTLKISALLGIDPVAGSNVVQSELDPPILNHDPFNFTIPVTVIGTGLGGVAQCIMPCAPKTLNHDQFFKRCAYSNHAHFCAKDYGHMDVLNDNPKDPKSWVMSKCICKNGDPPRDLMRRGVGGIAVAFLKDCFDGDCDDFNTILKDPSVAPIVLDQVQFIPAAAPAKF